MSFLVAYFELGSWEFLVLKVAGIFASAWVNLQVKRGLLRRGEDPHTF